MSTNEEAMEYKEEYESWLKDYEVDDFLENTPENWEKVQKMDPRLVWTAHGTCEDPQVTSGARMYGGRCCWDTYGWHIAKKQWEIQGDIDSTFESYKTGIYSNCPSCNADGEDEIEESDTECPGDENFPECECYDGYINYYWD